jgi:protein YIPF5/7
MWQQDNNIYGASSSQNSYYGHQPQGTPLQFYAPGPSASDAQFYPSSRSSLDGQMGVQGSISSGNSPAGYGGNIQPAGGWWTAFGTGGFEGEPPLLEGTKLEHLLLKLCAAFNVDITRTWDQLCTYTCKINDCIKSIWQSRRAHYG